METAEGEWRKILIEGHRPLLMSRWVWRHLPSPPRCKVCANPFAGPGGRLARVAGYKRSRKNPNLCTRCCDSMPPGGAEVDVAVLFADVRGSTGFAERTGATEYAELLNRFYALVTKVLLRHDALIDKLIGDEAMALFIPGVAGADYRQKALSAALNILSELGYGSPTGSWLPVGVGLHAGQAYVGNIGSEIVDFTALGDAVNVAARMQARAAAGQLVVSEDLLGDLATQLPVDTTRQLLELEGRKAPIAALVAEMRESTRS